ncbi:MAG: hypothetical protein R3F43_11425 [bacterium]
MIQTSAPGKVLLFGEYAVLDGGQALVAAVARRAHCTVEPAPGVEVIGEGVGRLAWPDPSAEDLPFARALFALQAPPPGRYTLESTSFSERGGRMKLGLGSSAATTVALAAAVRHTIRPRSSASPRPPTAPRRGRGAAPMSPPSPSAASSPTAGIEGSLPPATARPPSGRSRVGAIAWPSPGAGVPPAPPPWSAACRPSPRPIRCGTGGWISSPRRRRRPPSPGPTVATSPIRRRPASRRWLPSARRRASSSSCRPTGGSTPSPAPMGAG